MAHRWPAAAPGTQPSSPQCKRQQVRLPGTLGVVSAEEGPPERALEGEAGVATNGYSSVDSLPAAAGGQETGSR